MKVSWQLTDAEVALLDAMAADRDEHPSALGRRLLAELLAMLNEAWAQGVKPDEIAFKISGPQAIKH